MKAISLWQPWASAMAFGSKTIETRHWLTNVRGTVAIHAAKRCVKSELISMMCTGPWQGAVAEPLVGQLAKHPGAWNVGDLPFGAIVAVGQLVDCRKTDDVWLTEVYEKRTSASGLYSWTEHDMGNYELGRYAWFFEGVRQLTEPVPFKGKQGFFNVPDELLEGKF